MECSWCVFWHRCLLKILFTLDAMRKQDVVAPTLSLPQDPKSLYLAVFKNVRPTPLPTPLVMEPSLHLPTIATNAHPLLQDMHRRLHQSHEPTLNVQRARQMDLGILPHRVHLTTPSRLMPEALLLARLRDVRVPETRGVDLQLRTPEEILVRPSIQSFGCADSRMLSTLTSLRCRNNNIVNLIENTQQNKIIFVLQA